MGKRMVVLVMGWCSPRAPPSRSGAVLVATDGSTPSLLPPLVSGFSLAPWLPSSSCGLFACWQGGKVVMALLAVLVRVVVNGV